MYRLEDGTRVCLDENDYGRYIVKDTSKEEDGLSFDVLDALEPSTTLPKVPKALFNKVIKFFYDYASKSLEVHARVVYSPKYKQWRCFVPQQTIAGASVERYDYKDARDLETGEIVSLPHQNYVTVWQWHVHPFDLPDPSHIDDEGFHNQPNTGELYFPGGYGVASTWRAVNNKMCCTLRCTVVVNDGFSSKNKRLNIPTSAVVEGLADGECVSIYSTEYNSQVHSVIKRYVAPAAPAQIKPVIKQAGTVQTPYQSYAWDYYDFYLPQQGISQDLVLSQFSLEEVIGILSVRYTKEDMRQAINKVEE